MDYGHHALPALRCLRRVALSMGLELRVGVHPTLRPPQKKIGFPDRHNYASIRL